MTLTIQVLIDLVGAEAFEAACREATSASQLDDVASDVPHDFSHRLWVEGDESISERLEVAIELYRRMPAYANTMLWGTYGFTDADWDRMWEFYREMLGDPRSAFAEPIAYALWVDHFEDVSTVDRAWRGVAGPQEPRRPRLDRVVGASGPVPWHLKEPLYAALAEEDGWDAAIFEGLYGSCVDVYGALDREAGLHILRRLTPRPSDWRDPVLRAALADPALPDFGPDRRSYVSSRAP